jgi:streptomycin 6-kinase
METFDRFLEETAARIGAEADGWAAAARGLVERLADRWELELATEELPEEPTGSAFAVPGVRGGADPVLLRIVYPDAWFEEETAALVHWDGNGTVSLIDHDPAGAQLLERPEPGTRLAEEEEEDVALGRAAEVAGRLWIADPGGIATLASEVLEWGRTMPGRHHLVGRPFERTLVHEAVESIRELVPTQPEHVLLHGDLRLGTILAARGGIWLATEPKPLVGERAFDVVSLLREDPEALTADRTAGLERLQQRFDLLSERLGLNRKRVQRWAVAASVDDALWAFEGGDPAGGERKIDVVRMLRDLRV